jgi:hypothetical protein
MEALQEFGPLVVLILVGLFGVAKVVVNQMAKRPIVDGWDDAKNVLDKLSPIANQLEEWADPKSDAVPPSPSNPGGLA